MAIPASVPIVISCASVTLALIAFLYQVRRARFNQSIDLLFKLENDFFGAAKRGQRVKAARGLLVGESLEAEPILDFFETMAMLERRGALDKEMVAHTFFHWIDRYYEATRDIIAARQIVEPRVWKDLGAFVASLRSFASAQQHIPYRPPTPEQIFAFLNEELTEAD